MPSAMIDMFAFSNFRQKHSFASASKRNELGNALSHELEMTTVVSRPDWPGLVAF
jgi:hypothetical protein